MATMKAHLSDVHNRLAKHHAAVAGHYQDLAACIAKASNDEATKDSKCALEGLAREHEDMAQFHADCSERCAKAADADMNKMLPTSISAVVPDHPSVRAIPRFGQKSVPGSPNVDPLFARLVEHPDTEQNMTGWR
jgi:hypothetical protein